MFTTVLQNDTPFDATFVESVELKNEQAVQELSALELCLVGGGIGSVTFA